MINSDNGLLHAEITDKIIAAAYEVYNQLGFGFSEKVYENAMMIKIAQKDLKASSEYLSAFYSNQILLVNILPTCLWKTR